MQRLFLSALILLILGSMAFVHAYDLPEVLVLIQGYPEDSSAFGLEFTCVGDQNGDGCADLLVNHDPMQSSSRIRRQNRLNRVELYYGGENMDDDLDFMFTTDDSLISLGERICFVGNIMPDRNPFVIIQNTLAVPRNLQQIEFHLNFFETGDELDNEPEFRIRTPIREDGVPTILNSFGLKYRPTDFNGDGLDDVVLSRMLQDEERHCYLEIYFGGADFDTIPDWSSSMWVGGAATVTGGYDVNGDGYQDLLVNYGISPLARYFSLFLGGDPPDTNAVFTFPRDHFEGLGITDFSLLPDINGDGYDDWGLAYADEAHWPGNGYYVFFGGPEPDMEPDVELDGDQAIMGGGSLTGGNFNGDNYGDVVTGNSYAHHGDGQINIHFGRPGWPEFKEPDIDFDGYNDFPPHTFGGLGSLIDAVGDYNSDGIDDFVTRASGRNIAIFAGSRTWRVGVPVDPIPTSFELSLKAYPNPFNSSITLSFDIPTSGNVALTLYDIQGKQVASLIDQRLSLGRHTTVWNGDGFSAGIYFAVMSFNSSSVAERAVTKLVLVP